MGKGTRKHGQHANSDAGNNKLATPRQKAFVVEKVRWLLNPKAGRMKARQLERHTSRSNGFWYAARKGVWGRLKPTVADYNDIKRIYDIASGFDGQRIDLLECALAINERQAQLTIAVNHFFEIALKGHK